MKSECVSASGSSSQPLKIYSFSERMLLDFECCHFYRLVSSMISVRSCLCFDRKMPIDGNAQVGLVTLYESVFNSYMGNVRVSFSGIVRVSVRLHYKQAGSIVNSSRDSLLECHLHG